MSNHKSVENVQIVGSNNITQANDSMVFFTIAFLGEHHGISLFTTCARESAASLDSCFLMATQRYHPIISARMSIRLQYPAITISIDRIDRELSVFFAGAVRGRFPLPLFHHVCWLRALYCSISPLRLCPAPSRFAVFSPLSLAWLSPFPVLSRLTMRRL